MLCTVGGRVEVPEKLSIEIVFAMPDKQSLLSLEVDAGASVQDAILQSRIADLFPETEMDSLPVGVWGKPVQRDYRVRSGDRIEIYRTLSINPREARRQLALAGRTMSDPTESKKQTE